MTVRDARRFELVVGPEGAGERLDRWLAEALALSRTRVAALVEEGRVRWNGDAPRKSEPLAEGDRVEVELPPPALPRAEPEALPLDIVHEDADIVVVDKAAGMVVHPAPGHPSGTLVNALLHHVRDLSGIGGELRPGIVHRLDRDTSGLLVVAKHDAAHQVLSEALRKRKIRRLYRAASWGHLSDTPLRVDAPIARDPRNRKRMAVVEGGRRAVSHLRVRERWVAADYVDVALETGRTHQIRVHMAHLGHPVVGDRTYGGGWERGLGGENRRWAEALAKRVPRHFLHARRLEFRHPVTGRIMAFESPLPEDLERVVRWVRGGAGEVE